VAVLAKLNIKIPVEDFIKAIHDEEEARRVEPTAEATQLLARSLQRTSPSFPVTLPLMEPPGTLTPVPKFIPRSPTPTNDDPRAKERRRRVAELAEQTFPDGKAPDPYTSVWLWSLQDAAINKLPFITASRIVVSSATAKSPNMPQTVFEDIMCLWDSGAQTSYIVTSRLHASVRDNKTEGSAIMDIRCGPFYYSRLAVVYAHGVHQFLRREQNHQFNHLLPSSAPQRLDVHYPWSTRESILDPLPHLKHWKQIRLVCHLQGLLNRIQYQVRPVLVNPELLQLSPQAYGQMVRSGG